MPSVFASSTNDRDDGKRQGAAFGDRHCRSRGMEMIGQNTGVRQRQALQAFPAERDRIRFTLLEKLQRLGDLAEPKDLCLGGAAGAPQSRGSLDAGDGQIFAIHVRDLVDLRVGVDEIGAVSEIIIRTEIHLGFAFGVDRHERDIPDIAVHQFDDVSRTGMDDEFVGNLQSGAQGVAEVDRYAGRLARLHRGRPKARNAPRRRRWRSAIRPSAKAPRARHRLVQS